MTRETDLRRLVEEAVRLSTYGANVRCEVHLAPHLWSAEIDGTQITQVLNNLLINARQAMPSGGVIQVGAQNVVIDAGTDLDEIGAPLAPGRYVAISVRDRGCGIPEGDLGRIFDPFYTTKPIGSGTGLGLSTTYGIIKSHEGMISVDSQPNRGTTFKMLFSLVLDGKQSEQKNAPLITRGKGQRVLVVDDEPEILKAMQDLLEYLGYTPELAANGKEGLEKYRDNRPDAVLMDINMPEMDGITCIEKIFDNDPHANISIFSGYEEEGIENMSQWAKDAIKDYLAKPVGLEALSALLAKMLKDKK